jgi:hypothetical protein
MMKTQGETHYKAGDVFPREQNRPTEFMHAKARDVHRDRLTRELVSQADNLP